MTKFIYADNAATTKISDSVFEAMLPYLKEEYGNPSSVYKLGRESKKAIEAAREKVAGAIGANQAEIYFTSGGSESDNWALKSFGRALAKKGKNHIVTTVFEHHAILHTAQALEKEGFEVTYLEVNKQGLVEPETLKKALKPNTGLVSVIYVNNEIGTIQPIAELGKICHDAGVLFHTDAVQAIGKVEINVVEQNIDLLSLTAHKIHGPKGIGALYVRKGLPVAPYIDGGAQERGKRAGTENTAGIVGLGVAIEQACTDIAGRNQKLVKIRDILIDGLLTVRHSRLNGDREKRISSNVNISFAGVEGESLLLMLDFAGIAASSGSACTSGSLDPSHVLLAIGLIHEVAHGSLRLSIADDTTEEEARYIIETTKTIVDKLRAMSPMWEKIEQDPDYRVD